MMNTVISPSLMCADQLRLADDIERLCKLGVDYLHIDVMDGHFVPNIMLGTQLIKELKKSVSTRLDIHLMIDEPTKKLKWFDFGCGDIVSVHYESEKNLSEALCAIHSGGASAYLAINPQTGIDRVLPYIDMLDGVLIMTVQPGHCGQPMACGMLDKIKKLRDLLDSHGANNIRIEVDGCAGFDNAPKMRAAGADTFVVGTSSVFNKEHSIEENYERLKKLLV